MKILVTESQYNRILKEEEEEKIIRIPSLDFFHEDSWEAWKILQKFLESKGNPPYTIGGDLDLYGLPVKSLGNLQSVGGYLDLRGTPIKSLGNLTSVGGFLDLEGTQIESLGNLISVGSNLFFGGTQIESLGNLISVEGSLGLENTPLSKKYNKKDIRKMVDVGGDIFF